MTGQNAPQNNSKIPGRSISYPYLSQLIITGFRSYERLALDVDPRPVVLTGPNGTGKTNILEAISCLGPGRGLRGAPKSDLVRKSGGRAGPGWGIHATLVTGVGPLTLATGMVGDAADNRQITRLNGTSVTATEVAQTIRLVWLTPAMDRLFIEGAGNRRRFYDRLVLAFDPGHGSRVNAYEKAMRERARLLREPDYDTAWISALETRMAENGIAIAASRQALLAALMASIGKGSADYGEFPSAGLMIACEVQAWLENMPALDAEERLKEALVDNRPLDAGAGRTLRGVHRADLSVHHHQKQMDAAQCSTGEQKALLITILLAHARLQKGQGSECAPVLLLDEITAHLDEARRRNLFDAIAGLGLQAWMTGTDAEMFEDWGPGAQYYSLPEFGRASE